MESLPGAGGGAGGNGGQGYSWPPPGSGSGNNWPPHPDPNHVHGPNCGCADWFKQLDFFGKDLFDCIMIEGI